MKTKIPLWIAVVAMIATALLTWWLTGYLKPELLKQAVQKRDSIAATIPKLEKTIDTTLESAANTSAGTAQKSRTIIKYIPYEKYSPVADTTREYKFGVLTSAE